MPVIKTNICGTHNTRRALSRLCHLVVRTRSTTIETEVATLITKMEAVESPCLVTEIVSGISRGPRDDHFSNLMSVTRLYPETATLNRAGMAIIPEKRGMKRQTRAMKNIKGILEATATTRMSR